MIDPAGVRSAYVYDLKGRLSEIWYDGALVEAYRYDAADNIIAKLDQAGRAVVSVEIGPKNLKTARRLASGETHRFAYTERGYYAVAATDDISVKFDYDQFFNRTLDARDGRGVEHLFDGPDSLQQTIVLKRFTTRYRWLSNRTLEVRDPGGRTHQVHFLKGGGVARIMSSGLAEVARFDDAGRCLAKASSTARGLAWGAPWIRQFSYSGEGDLLEVSDSIGGTTRYEYDAAHRLRQAVEEGGTRETFRHDMGDNLLEQPGLAGVSIASGNRLRSANGDEFEYDNRGNVRHAAVTAASRATSTTRETCSFPAGPSAASGVPRTIHWGDASGSRWAMNGASFTGTPIASRLSFATMAARVYVTQTRSLWSRYSGWTMQIRKPIRRAAGDISCSATTSALRCASKTRSAMWCGAHG